MTPTQRQREKLSDRSIEDCPVVELTDQEYRIAKHIAAARTISYEGVSGTTFGNQDASEAHLIGVLGEMAVAHVANTEMDDHIYVRGDPGHDLVIDDHTADVKTTATDLPVPDLLVPAEPRPDADIYILAHRISKRRIRLVGWADWRTVTSRDPQRFPGSQLNYVVEADELDAIPTK